jgi:hypothetical protein
MGMEIHTKVCCKCKQKLNISNFRRNSHEPDGYHYICKECSHLLASTKTKTKTYILPIGGKKVCPKCGLEKDLSEFSKNKASKDGLMWRCKECHSQYNSQHYKDNKEDRLEYQNQYFQDNKEVIYQHINQRRHTDENFRIAQCLHNRIYTALKSQNVKKKEKMRDLVGCNGDELFLYFEVNQMYQPGMTRQNYGKWHIDHIRPCASFDLRNVEEQKKCFNYTNLQPLWAADNFSKGAKWDGSDPKSD